MKKIIIFGLLSFSIFNISADNITDTIVDMLNKYGLFRSYGSDNGGHAGLTATGAFAGGALSNEILKKFGFNNNKLLSLVRIMISMFGPGLLAADYLDDKRINGSIFRDCAGLLKFDKNCMEKLWQVLLTRSGIANVAFSGLGVLTTEYFDSN